MIEIWKNLLLEPRQPRRYVGKHRAPTLLPQITFAVRRTWGAVA